MAEYTREEVLEKVKAGESLEIAGLRGLNLSDISLSGADLSHANLSGANLSEAECIGANFSKASLSRTNLSSINCYRADFISADLRGADLSGAELSGVDFSGVELSGAFIIDAELIRANFSSANLSTVVLRDSDLASVDFEEANLTDADISGANICNIKTPGWKIDNIKCTHTYCHPLGATEEQREKSKRKYEEGEFEALYKFIPTVELYFKEGFSLIDDMRLIDIHQRIQADMPDATIRFKKKEWVGNDMVITLGVEELDKVEEVAEAVKAKYADKALEKEQLQRLEESVTKNVLQQLQSGLSNMLSGGSEPSGNNAPINVFNAPVNIFTLTGKGHTVLSDSTAKNCQTGAGSTADFSKNYHKNRVDANGLIKQLRSLIDEEQKALVDRFTTALQAKDDSKAQRVWNEVKTGAGTGAAVVSIVTNLGTLLGLPPLM